MAKITVCSKLRNGLIIEHPKNPEIRARINGVNSSRIIGATHANTEIDQELWGAWEAVNKNFPALKNGAIFAVKVQQDAEVEAKNRESVRTGLEPLLKKNDPRTKGTGVMPAEFA
jgi:hypothetical protein